MVEADLREIKQYLTQHLLQQWEQHLIEKMEQKYATGQHKDDGTSNMFLDQMNMRFVEQREYIDRRFEDVIRLIAEQRENNDKRFVEQRENNDKRFDAFQTQLRITTSSLSSNAGIMTSALPNRMRTI